MSVVPIGCFACALKLVRVEIVNEWSWALLFDIAARLARENPELIKLRAIQAIERGKGRRAADRRAEAGARIT